MRPTCRICRAARDPSGSTSSQRKNTHPEVASTYERAPIRCGHASAADRPRSRRDARNDARDAVRARAGRGVEDACGAGGSTGTHARVEWVPVGRGHVVVPGRRWDPMSSLARTGNAVGADADSVRRLRLFQQQLQHPAARPGQCRDPHLAGRDQRGPRVPAGVLQAGFRQCPHALLERAPYQPRVGTDPTGAADPTQRRSEPEQFRPERHQRL